MPASRSRSLRRSRAGFRSWVSAWVIRRFRLLPFRLTMGITGLVMLPGMITGSSSAAVLTAGAIVTPALLKLGVPPVKAAAAIALAAIYGMEATLRHMDRMNRGRGLSRDNLRDGHPRLDGASRA